MNRSIPVIFVLVFLMASCMVIVEPVKASADFWVTKAPMPKAETGLGAIGVNGKVYAFMSDGTNEEYDPAIDTWSAKTPVPTPRSNVAVAAYQNKIYCIGGAINNTWTGANEAYDPATNKWETKAQMPVVVAGFQANIANGKIYVISGTSPNSPSVSLINITQVYDPTTDSWTTRAPIPTPVHSYASAVVDDKIYVIGGSTSNAITRQVQIYTPKTNIWTTGSPIPTAVADTAAGATTGKLAPKRIYVLGGRSYAFGEVGYGLAGTTLNQVYYPANDSWTLSASMPTARFGLAVAVANDMLYALGGAPQFNLNRGSLLAVNEQYTPIEYGTPDPTYQSPTPLPSPSSTMTASLSESASALNYGNTINFTVSTEGGTPPYTYEWYMDNQLAETSISPYFSTDSQAVGSHHVYVQVTDADNNSATTLAVEFNVLSGSSSSPGTSLSPSDFPTQQPTSTPTQSATPTESPHSLPPLPYSLITAGSAVTAAIIIVGLAVYFTKYRKKKEVS